MDGLSSLPGNKLVKNITELDFEFIFGNKTFVWRCGQMQMHYERIIGRGYWLCVKNINRRFAGMVVFKASSSAPGAIKPARNVFTKKVSPSSSNEASCARNFFKEK